MYIPSKLSISDINSFEVTIHDEKQKFILVNVNKQDYIECEERSYSFWGNNKPGAYGKGLGATNSDQYKPARVGLLAQMAFGKLIEYPVDTEYRQGGDQYDFLIFNHKFDIKCSMKYREDILIYHKNEWGKEIPLDKDIYVCSYLKEEDRILKTANIVFTGFALQKNIKKCKIEKGRKGNGHLNYVLPIYNLSSIDKLIERIKIRGKNN